jgi:hypothetical protein
MCRLVDCKRAAFAAIAFAIDLGKYAFALWHLADRHDLGRVISDVRNSDRHRRRRNLRLLAHRASAGRALGLPAGCASTKMKAPSTAAGAFGPWGRGTGGWGSRPADLLQCANWSGVPNSRGTPSLPSPRRAFGLVSEFPNRRSGRSRLRFDQRKSPGLVSRAAISSPGRQRLCRCSVSRGRLKQNRDGWSFRPDGHPEVRSLEQGHVGSLD